MSNNIGRTLVTANQNQKTVTINDSDGRIDAALTELLSSDYTSGNITLTDAEFQQAMTFVTANLTVARVLTVPVFKKLFVVDNTAGTAAVTVTRGSGTVVVAIAERSLIYTDGTTNGITEISGSAGGSALTVEDEGSPLSTAATKLNFAGAGVTVTEPVTDEMLVTIPGSGGGGPTTLPPFQGVRVRKSANQVLTAATSIQVVWDVEDFDTDAMHDNVTNNTRITVPVGSGITKVMLNFNLDLGTPSTGVILASFIRNGGVGEGGQSQNAFSGSELFSAIVGPVAVSEGDYFEVNIFSSVVGQLDAVLGTNFSMMAVENATSILIPITHIIEVSDETTDLTTGVAKVTFRVPSAMTLTDVRCSVNTAPTGSVITVDINESGATILSTKLTIDATEKTSETAAIPVVISDVDLADDAEITIDIDTIGSTIAGKGLKVVLIGTQA